MCGRFTNEMTWAEIHALYALAPGSPPSNAPPRFNIAPTQDIQFCRLSSEADRTLDDGRWWLVPFWAREIPKAALFNARIETADTTPAFREAFKSKRCLIPADGYFEWSKGEDSGKDPWLFELPDGAGFSFAGLWAHNEHLSVTSCTIITAPAVPHIEHIHPRMPLILDPSAYDAWLDLETSVPEANAVLMHQINDQLTYHRVSRNVNSSKYEGTDTKKPLVNSL
jgi:putative SOS response-associated peptidase YedK